MKFAPTRLIRSAALILGLSALAYYGVLVHLDWWLYQCRHREPVRDVASTLQPLAQSGLPVQQLGVVHAEGKDWPLEAVLIRRPQATRTACIVGGIHGNEPAGTEAALSLIHDLAQQPTLYADTNFAILPLANPWGYAHDLRHNADNLDIARNFTSGGTAETALIKPFLDRQHCDILIDLHEDRLDRGFYLLSYENPKAAALPTLASAIARDSGIAPSRRAPGGLMLIREKDFATQERTTLSLYAREHGTTYSYIIESPKRLEMKERVRLHRLWIDTLLGLPPATQ